MTATFFRFGRGRSRSAERAEDEGLAPLTRAAIAIADDVGCTRAFAAKCLRRVGPQEWHHVGKYAAEVDYYATDGVAYRMAGIFFGCANRAKVLAARTRRAWQEHESRMLAAQKKGLPAMPARESIEERIAREVCAEESALRREAERVARAKERQTHFAGLLRNFLRNPKPSRAEILARQFGVRDPYSLVETWGF